MKSEGKNHPNINREPEGRRERTGVSEVCLFITSHVTPILTTSSIHYSPTSSSFTDVNRHHASSAGALWFPRTRWRFQSDFIYIDHQKTVWSNNNPGVVRPERRLWIRPLLSVISFSQLHRLVHRDSSRPVASSLRFSGAAGRQWKSEWNASREMLNVSHCSERAACGTRTLLDRLSDILHFSRGGVSTARSVNQNVTVFLHRRLDGAAAARLQSHVALELQRTQSFSNSRLTQVDSWWFRSSSVQDVRAPERTSLRFKLLESSDIVIQM